jgi:GAF domain-containing protein
VACTRIQYGKGVCGTAWEKKTTLVVPDVDAFPGHIACSSLSRSELVFPIFSKKNEIIGVLDIDSSEPDDFSETDVQYLEKMLRNLSAILDPDFSA